MSARISRWHRSTPWRRTSPGSPSPSEAQVADLIRLAARVPDHGKLAPWRFVVVEGDGKAAFAARWEDYWE